MFQDYALFPHMSVAENIEYGLRVRRVDRAARRERTGRALEMVRLAGLGGRKPASRRSAPTRRLARAINEPPEVLLLDDIGAPDLRSGPAA